MDGLDIQLLVQLCKDQKIHWTEHVVIRLLQRGILQEEVEQVVMNGEIIEQYPDDYPHPSCLVFGTTIKGEMLHVVCGIADGFLWIITAYRPDEKLWQKNFKIRRKGGQRK